jgi:hypothetical protein
MKIISFTLLLLSTSFLSAATPTWQWLDGNGRKVYSDRAPPPEIPANKILKRPAGMDAPPEPRYGIPSAAPEPKETALSAATPSKTLAGLDKELEARKKKREEEELANRKAEEARIAQAQAENCKRARDAKATYESGARISRTNAAGEREMLDDASRAAEVKRLNEVIASDCK